MISDGLFHRINNFRISGEIGYPYRMEGIDNSLDPLGRYGDCIIEICNIRIDKLTEDEFYIELQTLQKDYLLSLYTQTSECKNKAAALMIYDNAISEIQDEINKYITRGEITQLKGENLRGILYTNWGEANQIHPNTLDGMEQEVWDRLAGLIYQMILVPLLSQVNLDQQRLFITRLIDFKKALQIRIPKKETPRPTLQRNHFSFELNQSILESGMSRDKIGRLCELLTRQFMIEDSDNVTKAFLRIFRNKPVDNKVVLEKPFTKAFLKTLLQELYENKIIINSDYYKVASVCFEFAEDPSYDWDKLRKTSPLKSELMLNLVEKCVNIFI